MLFMFRFPFIRITLNCLYILYTPERLMNLYKRFTSYIQKNLNNKYYDAAKLAEYFFLKSSWFMSNCIQLQHLPTKVHQNVNAVWCTVI